MKKKNVKPQEVVAGKVEPKKAKCSQLKCAIVSALVSLVLGAITYNVMDSRKEAAIKLSALRERNCKYITACLGVDEKEGRYTESHQVRGSWRYEDLVESGRLISNNYGEDYFFPIAKQADMSDVYSTVCGATLAYENIKRQREALKAIEKERQAEVELFEKNMKAKKRSHK